VVMPQKSIRKFHKKAGLWAGLFLLVLSLTGFFLNHDQWRFQYDWTVSNTLLPESVAEADKKLFQAKTSRPGHANWLIVGGLRGAYISTDGGQQYQLTSRHQIYALRWFEERLLAATESGILQSFDYGQNWQPFALEGLWINALAVDHHKILASIEKTTLVVLNREGGIEHQQGVELPHDELIDEVNLSRLVRDLHYGRGLFDDGWSLLLNDVATWLLIFSILSGTWIWWGLRRLKQRKILLPSLTDANKNRSNKAANIKQMIRLHSYGLVLFSVPLLLLFAVTGVVLDHSEGLGKPLKSVTVKVEHLPPIYRSLREDIWSVDIEYDEEGVWHYRMGNRYGVYESDSLQDWQRVSEGFAYRMKRLGDTLYVSGMGAPSRMYHAETGWLNAKLPHMFRDIYTVNQQNVVFCGHSKKADHHTPKLPDSSFYSIMLTLHDGTFFASWWVWVNDYASLMLLVLLFTGVMRWFKKKHRIGSVRA